MLASTESDREPPPAPRPEEPADFARLLAAWPEPALLVARDGRVLAANASARALLGVPPESDVLRLSELVGAALAEHLLGAGREPREGVVGDDPAPGVRPVVRARAGSLDGELVLVALADASGEHRLRSHLELAERLASVGELLSSVAHELNNPLTAVLGYADLLLAYPGAPVSHDEIRRIRDEAQRCRRIVGNLLDLVRAGPQEFRPLLVRDVVEKVHEFRAYAASVTEVTLLREHEPDLPFVQGDFHRLVQAVLNLVTNAEDAVRGGGPPRQVVVRTRRAGDRVAIEVEDTGPGVPEALREFIFQPFFTTKPRGRGTGLGLSLVRATAERHGGAARVERAPAGGALFVIEIPVA